MHVRISRSLLETLRAQTAASPAVEICGLLFGAAGAIIHARPTANVHPDPARHFEVDPAALVAAHKAARAGGPCLVGHYHSHPTGSAAASAADAEGTAPGQLCLILAGGTHRLYRGAPDGLVPVDLRVTAD